MAVLARGQLRLRPDARRGWQYDDRRFSLRVTAMDSSKQLAVLGIAGSLRKGSYNRGLLRAAQGLAPSGLRVEAFEIGDIPLYNDDVYAQGFPAAVETFRARIRAADALLIVTPEYNYSVPGVLKNAIDWASRPPNQPFDGKPVALMGASAGVFGTTARREDSGRRVRIASEPIRHSGQRSFTDAEEFGVHHHRQATFQKTV